MLLPPEAWNNKQIEYGYVTKGKGEEKRREEKRREEKRREEKRREEKGKKISKREESNDHHPRIPDALASLLKKRKKEEKRGKEEKRKELLMINVLLRTLTRSAENIRVKQSTMAEQKRHM